MKVLHFKHADDGCSWYRHVVPQRAMREQGIEFIEIDPKMSDEALIDLCKKADVLFVRAAFNNLWSIYDIVREANPKLAIIADTDDDIEDIAPNNIAYDSMGQAEIKLDPPIVDKDGKTHEWLWQHGKKNFDLRMNRHRLIDYIWGLEQADIVTTTTLRLKEALERHNDKVVVLPNALLPEYWPDVQRPNDGKIRIVWSGGASHYDDLKLCSEALINILKTYPQVELHIAGQGFPAFDRWFKEWKGTRFFLHPWIKADGQSFRLATLTPDIGICPLEDKPFNANKSCIKFYEYSAVGAATVASGVAPYSDEIQQESTGLLADPDNFYKAIATLIDDPILRLKLAANAREWTWKHRNANDVAKQYIKVFEAAIKDKGGK